jgi:hypothetical protein
VSLTPLESELPTPLDEPVALDSIVPLLSDAPEECASDAPVLLDELLEEPADVDDELLPLTPALTLAEATPGTPPLTEPPAFQPSVSPVVVEELDPVDVELPLLDALVSVSEVECPLDVPLVELDEAPDDTLSL